MNFQSSIVRLLQKINLFLFALVIVISFGEIAQANPLQCQNYFEEKIRVGELDAELMRELSENPKILEKVLMENSISKKDYEFLENKVEERKLKSDILHQVKEAKKKGKIERDYEFTIELQIELANAEIVNLKINTIGGKVTEKEFIRAAELYVKSLKKVGKFLPGIFTPNNLEVTLYSVWNNAFHFVDSIHIPSRIKLTESSGKNRQSGTKHYVSMESVFIHEFGHDILLKALWQSGFSKFRKYANGIEDLGKMQNELDKLLVEYEKTNEKITREEVRLEELLTELDRIDVENIEGVSRNKENASYKSIKKVEEEIIAREKEVGKLVKLLEEITTKAENLSKEGEVIMARIETTHEVVGHYNEFFADVIAVIGKDYNARAISDSLYTPALIAEYGQKAVEKMKRLNKFRDFEVAVDINKFNENEEHISLNPTRNWIWENYMRHDHFQSNTMSYTHKLIEAIEQTAIYELKALEKGKTLSVKERNLKLQKNIDIFFEELKGI